MITDHGNVAAFARIRSDISLEIVNDSRRCVTAKVSASLAATAGFSNEITETRYRDKCE